MKEPYQPIAGLMYDNYFKGGRYKEVPMTYCEKLLEFLYLDDSEARGLIDSTFKIVGGDLKLDTLRSSLETLVKIKNEDGKINGHTTSLETLAVFCHFLSKAKL